MAEISTTKNVQDSDVGLSTVTAEITVTSVAPASLSLYESDQSAPVLYSNGDLAYDETVDGYIVAGRGEFNSSTLVIGEMRLGKPIIGIKESAFINDTGLLSVTIPKNIRIIGDNAFSGCTELTSLTLHDSDTTVIFFKNSGGWSVPYLYYTTASSNNVWPGDAMKCWNVDEKIFCLAIPSNATSIIFNSGNGAYQTSEITNLIVNNMCFEARAKSEPEGEITHSAIPDYYAPQNFNLYESLAIGESAFEGCSALESVEIPRRTVNIRAQAFKDCINCKTLTFLSDSRLVEIGSDAFGDCKSLASVTLPEGLTTMGSGAFARCTNLETVKIPAHTLEAISFMAFSGCSMLTTVSYRNNAWLSYPRLKEIKPWAFEKCASLEETSIPPHVEIVGANAFSGCTALTRVYFKTTSGAWFVSKKSDPETTDLTLVKPNVLEWRTTNEWGAEYAACLLREYYNADLPNHNEDNLHHAVNGVTGETHEIFAGSVYDGNIGGYADYYWYWRNQMVRPTISLTNSILTMTDPSGVAEAFWIYVNGEKRCQVLPGATASE